MLPAVEWAANEVTDNVELHVSAETLGIFFAHLDVRRNRLKVANVDQSIGIRQSLERSLVGWNRIVISLERRRCDS